MTNETEAVRQAAIDVLNETDRILDTDGWSSNGANGPNGEVCLGVAKNRAARGLGLPQGMKEAADVEAGMAIHDEIRDFTGQIQHIFVFNDDTAESIEDIKRITKGARVRLGGES